MARYEDINEANPYPTEPAPTAPQDTSLFHGGLTLIRTDPNGKRVYQGADGTVWTDDPSMSSTSGFIPYTAPTAGVGTGPGEGTGATGPVPPGGTDVWDQPALLDVGGGVSGLPYLPATPVFTPPTYEKPPAFAYADFMAPTAEDVLSDPGYAFRRDEGANALMRSKAAQGVLNTGGSLKDFLKYNQAFATQEYGNVWDRAVNAYKLNRGNALDTYNTNYGTQTKDPYSFDYQAALDTFAPKMTAYGVQAQAGQRQNELNTSYSWQKWLEDERRRQQGFQNQFQVATA